VEERKGNRERERERCRRWRKREVPERRKTEEKEKWNSPKDLYVNLENYRDLLVK
jgi:hypothetical protein